MDLMRGLWIEDTLEIVNRSAPILRRHGVIVDGVHPKCGLSTLIMRASSYDMLLVDLEMPTSSFDGVDFLKRIEEEQKNIGVVVCSAHLEEQKWINRLGKLRTKYLTAEKPFPIEGTPDFRMLLDKVKTAKRLTDIKGPNPFAMKIDEFESKTDEELDKLFDIAEQLNSPFVESYFSENTDIDWIVISGAPGRIIAQGGCNDEPDESRLKMMVVEEDAPVFGYSREAHIVEENIGIGWPFKKESMDYYPSITLSMKGMEKQDACILKADFDTGSTWSFLSYELLREGNIVPRNVWQMRKPLKGSVFGSNYKYHKETLSCDLVDERNGSKTGVELDCHLVRNWNDSPVVMYYQGRHALVGRNIILRNKITIILDGSKKLTGFGEGI